MNSAISGAPRSGSALVASAGTPRAQKMADLYRKSAVARLSARVQILINFADRTIWIEHNPDIRRGRNSASVDVIYLDPPFNSNRNCAAPVCSAAARATYKGTWTLT